MNSTFQQKAFEAVSLLRFACTMNVLFRFFLAKSGTIFHEYYKFMLAQMLVTVFNENVIMPKPCSGVSFWFSEKILLHDELFAWESFFNVHISNEKRKKTAIAYNLRFNSIGKCIIQTTSAHICSKFSSSLMLSEDFNFLSRESQRHTNIHVLTASELHHQKHRFVT